MFGADFMSGRQRANRSAYHDGSAMCRLYQRNIQHSGQRFDVQNVDDLHCFSKSNHGRHGNERCRLRR